MKYSTCTATSTNQLVPWLSATGSLAYTPENPLTRDYFFQYDWVLPGVLNQTGNLRSHSYFGAGRRAEAREIFSFWNNARAGKAARLHLIHGTVSPHAVTAPIAIYRHTGTWRGEPGYMLIQHGSYQFIPKRYQPELENGHAYLYRGIQAETVFRYPTFAAGEPAAPCRKAWQAYLRTQAQVLSDSELSFNSIHDRAKRCETGGINDDSFISDEFAKRNGLRIEEDRFARLLWAAHQQSFSLDQGIAEWKFGPNYVVVKTPISDLRILTFFAGESEAKIVDPRKVEVVRCVGCQADNSLGPLPNPEPPVPTPSTLFQRAKRR